MLLYLLQALELSAADMQDLVQKFCLLARGCRNANPSSARGADAHFGSTFYSLLLAQGVWHGQAGEPSCRVSPPGQGSGEGSDYSFHIISDLIIQQRNKIQNKDPHVWIPCISGLSQLPFMRQLKDLVEKNSF